MDANEAEKVVRLLCDAFPWQELPGPTVDLWLTRLADLDHEVAERAAWEVIDTEERFPSVAAFLSAYRECRKQAIEEQETRALRLVLAQPPSPEKPVEPAAPPPPEFFDMLRKFRLQVAIPQEG